MNNWSVVYSSNSAAELHLVETMLINSGIECYVKNELSTIINPMINGIELLVMNSDVERAKSLIEKMEQQDSELMATVKSWARAVGEIHMKYFRSNNLEIQTKSNISDVVTICDKESEAYLLDVIRNKYPDDSVLGEETGSHEGSSEYSWVVDPLDGTNNFSQGLPIFSVSIGLQKNGKTILGVVYAPYLDEMYSAEIGHGAFLNGSPIRVSDKDNIHACVLGTGFPYDKATNPANNIENLASILPGLRGIRRMGSAAYDLCCVAAGFLDGYWELNLNAWDMCAGALIVEEAGGMIQHFRNDRRISIIAGNETIVSIIAKYVK